MPKLNDLIGWEGLYRAGPPSSCTAGSMRPGVTVVIPTWNAADLLRTCLEGLRRQELSPARVLVVDNASSDSTPDVVDGFPGVDIVRMEHNAGYAGALAKALDEADTEYLAALNNDAQPDSAWLAASVRMLNDEPRLGSVYPLAVRPDGSIDTAGDAITLAGFAYKRLYRCRVLSPPRGGLFVSPPGVAPVYRVAALREAGGWDAGLHSQWDDVDLGIRLWQAGWDAALCPGVRVVHRQGASSSRRAASREFLSARNETVILLKTLPVPLLCRVAIFHLPYLILAACSHLARGTALPFLAGKAAATASLGAILQARRRVRIRRRLAHTALDGRWLRMWFRLSRAGGRRAVEPA